MDTTIPVLRTELIRRLKNEEFVAVPASEQEYLDIAFEFSHKIEYHHSEIITLGLSSYYHETIVGKLIALLHVQFDSKDYFVLGGNSGVHIPKFEGDYFQPDVIAIKNKPEFKGKSKSIITNPFLLVEVLSKCSGRYDSEAKLPEYKQFVSLKYILLVDQQRVAISLYTKSGEPNTWINKDFYDLSDVITTSDFTLEVEDIYQKVDFS